MSHNRANAINTRLTEWGSKARKEEVRLRGINRTAERQAITEQTDDLNESQEG